MLIAAISILGTLICVLLGLILSELRHGTSVNQRVANELTELRLTARTRIRDYGVQSGEVSQEQQLERLGRASAARRVVVGGDDDSPQKQALVRQTRQGTRVGGEDNG